MIRFPPSHVLTTSKQPPPLCSSILQPVYAALLRSQRSRFIYIRARRHMHEGDSPADTGEALGRDRARGNPFSIDDDLSAFAGSAPTCSGDECTRGNGSPAQRRQRGSQFNLDSISRCQTRVSTRPSSNRRSPRCLGPRYKPQRETIDESNADQFGREQHHLCTNCNIGLSYLFTNFSCLNHR